MSFVDNILQLHTIVVGDSINQKHLLMTRSFKGLVDTLSDHLADEVDTRVFVWVDIFAGALLAYT